MNATVFECSNPKCSNFIASDGLNAVQLQVLRRWARTCPECLQRTKWQEKLPLLSTKQIQKKRGSKNAKRPKRLSEPNH